MADDGKKFDIELGTKADTSGLEATERALRDVEEAGKAAANPMTDGSQLATGALPEAVRETTTAVDDQRAAVGDLTQANADLERQQADVAEAQKRASERRIGDLEKEERAHRDAIQAEQDGNRLRAAGLAALAVAGRQIAANTVEVLKGYKDLGVELGTFEELGLEFAEFLSGPIDYVTDAFTGHKEELRQMAQEQRNVAQAEAVYLETLKRKYNELATASRNRIANFLAAEQRAIDENTAAYERQRRVIEALADADEARARAQDAMALANGADPAQVAAGAAARQNARDSSAQDAKIVAAEQKLEAAQQSYEAAVSALAQGQNGTREEIAVLSNAAQAAQAAVADAQAEVETVKTEAEAAKSAISSEAVAQQTGVVDAAKSALTQAAETAKTTLENEAAEQGKTLSAGGKEALKILTDALKDGVVTPEEMQAVATAIQQVKNSRDAADAEIRASFEQLEKANAVVLENQRVLTERLRQQAAQFERLQQELR
jgi:trimeric autotransporter adhesin